MDVDEEFNVLFNSQEFDVYDSEDDENESKRSRTAHPAAAEEDFDPDEAGEFEEFYEYALYQDDESVAIDGGGPSISTSACSSAAATVETTQTPNEPYTVQEIMMGARVVKLQGKMELIAAVSKKDLEKIGIQTLYTSLESMKKSKMSAQTAFNRMMDIYNAGVKTRENGDGMDLPQSVVEIIGFYDLAKEKAQELTMLRPENKVPRNETKEKRGKPQAKFYLSSSKPYNETMSPCPNLDPSITKCVKCHHGYVQFQVTERQYSQLCQLVDEQNLGQRNAATGSAKKTRMSGYPDRMIECTCRHNQCHGQVDGGSCPACRLKSLAGTHNDRHNANHCLVCDCHCAVAYKMSEIYELATQIAQQGLGNSSEPFL